MPRPPTYKSARKSSAELKGLSKVDVQSFAQHFDEAMSFALKSNRSA
jgi:hypothetical protein